jgi:hypothetical protein
VRKSPLYFELHIQTLNSSPENKNGTLMTGNKVISLGVEQVYYIKLKK